MTRAFRPNLFLIHECADLMDAEREIMLDRLRGVAPSVIARKHGVGTERVRVRVKNAMSKLRRWVEKHPHWRPVFTNYGFWLKENRHGTTDPERLPRVFGKRG